MKRCVKLFNAVLALVLCAMFVVSIADTGETVQHTNFNLNNMQPIAKNCISTCG